MNKISYELNSDYPSVYSGCPFNIILDGINTGYFFDIRCFEISSEKEGIFPLLVGGCGEMGCCGYYIEVKHEKDKIIWKQFYHGQTDPSEPEKDDELSEIKLNRGLSYNSPLVFDKKDYQNLTKELVKEIKKYDKEHKQYLSNIKYYSSGNYFRS